MTQASAQVESADTVEDEHSQIFRWRCTELRRAGYGLKDALLLAVNTEVDLHLAIDLPARGCPHTTAFRILS